MRKLVFVSVLLSSISFCGFAQKLQKEMKKPNVILVLTDDQGIGDLGCHGNPWLKTPNIDKFYKRAIRMTDFHVSSVCTPTRGAIISGRYPINNGAWATYKGRDALSEGTPTMADVFKQNGYITGMFGKWHLGDNYPVRPSDCGFDYVVQHKAGGVGELSDYWGNNYFNDVYFVNNKPKQFKGYCTDVWFGEAMKFVAKHKENPFFIYLATNAPHSPHYVDPKYAKPYKEKEGEEIVNADFYGMIANIDENFGKLDRFLKKKGLADNTILIFMTDNGATGGLSRDGKRGYNYGFRGRKGDKVEGGHRVPFFIRWKDGKIIGGKDIGTTTAHVDLIPTLAGLCGIQVPLNVHSDGVDFSPVLRGEKKNLEERTIFVHNRQDWRPPTDVAKTCILKENWRLVDGKELYDIQKDRKQKNDISEVYPEVVEQLLKDNAVFLKVTKQYPEYYQFPSFVVGGAGQVETKLTIQHAIGNDKPIWKSEQVAAGVLNQNNTHALRVASKGLYKISCRRWPKECSGKILGVPERNPKDWFSYKEISPEKVRIQIANQILEKNIHDEDEEVVFYVALDTGKTFLITDFVEGKKSYGVYYTYVKKMND